MMLVLLQLVLLISCSLSLNYAFQFPQKSIQHNILRLKSSYRLYDDEGVKALGPLAKPVGFILNTVGDLLRIQGDDANYPPEEALKVLSELLAKCQPNGLNAPTELREQIEGVVQTLEKFNPTPKPAYSSKMNGFWYLLYCDADKLGGASNGKFGPLVGRVYQDLNSEIKEIRNLFDVDFPPLKLGLLAKQSNFDSETWKIEFDRVGSKVFGAFPLIKKQFSPGTIRYWKITYLDDNFRVLRARAEESEDKKSVLFILTRADDKKFNSEFI